MIKKQEIIAKSIKVLRSTRRLTQEQLAAKVNKSVFTISQIERGIRNPRIDTLTDIAVALECSLDDLVFGPAGAGQKSVDGERHQVELAIWAELNGMLTGNLKACLKVVKAMKEGNQN